MPSRTAGRPVAKILSSEEVYKGPVFGVRRDKVLEPNGVRAIREVITHPGSVVVLPVLPDGRIVLIRQYRHATRSPEPYWREILRRDAGDSRANNALGRMNLRRGEFSRAEDRFRTAIARLTSRNPNPYDSEAYYNLGLTLLYQDRA